MNLAQIDPRLQKLCFDDLLLLQGLPGEFQDPKKSASCGLTNCQSSEGRGFLIAIVGCFSVAGARELESFD